MNVYVQPLVWSLSYTFLFSFFFSCSSSCCCYSYRYISLIYSPPCSPLLHSFRRPSAAYRHIDSTARTRSTEGIEIEKHHTGTRKLRKNVNEEDKRSLRLLEETEQFVAVNMPMSLREREKKEIYCANIFIQQI